MVRNVGKRSTGRDMTKALVKSHVATEPGRHSSPETVPAGPKVGQGAAHRARKARKVTAKM
jgi:hypothetical protein